MDIKEKKKPQLPKKPVIFYYVIVLIILAAVNLFLVPSLSESRIQDATYDQFLDALEEGRISKVNLNQDAIYYLEKDGDTEITVNSVRWPHVLMVMEFKKKQGTKRTGDVDLSDESERPTKRQSTSKSKAAVQVERVFATDSRAGIGPQTTAGASAPQESAETTPSMPHHYQSRRRYKSNTA